MDAITNKLKMNTTQPTEFTDKLILISDIHFGVRNDSAEWLDNMSSYFANFFIPLLRSKVNEGVAVCILGDLFDNRQSINIDTMNIASGIIRQIAELAPVYIMAGNHDMSRRSDSSLNSLVIVKGIPNVVVIDSYSSVHWKTSSGSSRRVGFIPYTGIYSKETEAVSKSNEDYIFLHTEVLGAIFDSGKPIKDGAVTTASPAKRIFSGHIHKRQELGKFTYIGSPYHLRRSDVGDLKGIYILNIDDDTLEFVPNRYSPIFQAVTLQSLLTMTLSEFKSYITNNYTDIIVPRDKAGDIEPYELLALLDRSTYKDVKFSIEKGLKMTEEGLPIEEEMPISSLEEVSYKYIDELDLPKEEKEHLVDLMRGYFNVANEKAKEV